MIWIYINKTINHNNIKIYNIIQADEISCDIITVPSDILKKLSMIGKDLTELSLETVKMFYDDAKSSGFSI